MTQTHYFAKAKGSFWHNGFFSHYDMACANLPSSNVDGMKIVVITFSLNPKPITLKIWCSFFVFVYHLLMFLAWMTMPQTFVS
jgi:hypothetical protein